MDEHGQELADLKKKVEAIREQVIDLVGLDGNGGRVGVKRRRLDALEDSKKQTRERLGELNVKVEKLGLKVAIAAAVAAALFGTAASLVAKLLFGG